VLAQKPRDLVFPCFSTRRFQIGSHHVRHAAHLRETPQRIGAARMLVEVILQRFHGDLSSDLVAVLEAIGHGLSRRINSHRHAVDRVRFRAFCQ
jgi:hypothetical protein